MKTIEELNQIKIANMIINRSSQRLGIKPVYVGDLINIKDKNKPIDELKIVAQKLSQEKFSKRNLKKNRLKFLNFKNLKIVFFILLAVAVVYSLLFVFKPAPATHQAEPQASEGLDEESTGIFKADGAQGMVITTGAFKTRAEAEKFRDELSEKLGVPLEILHDSKYFTIQIGPSYENHADAMVVYDELSRYSIGNLMLRRAG